MCLLTIVSQIPRRCPMKRLVDQQADLELDSKKCRTSRRSSVTWSYFLLLHSSLAAALRIDCRQSRRYLGEPTSRVLLRSTCDVTKAATAALAASKGKDLMQPFRRRTGRKQRRRVRATWTFIDRSD